MKQIDFSELQGRKGRKPTTQGTPLVLDNCADDVDTMIKVKRDMDAFKVAFESQRASLQVRAEDLRQEAEEAGDFNLQVMLKGRKDSVVMNFGHQFSEVQPQIEPEMRKHLGNGAFDALFQEVEEVSLKPGMTKELYALLRKARKKPERFFDTKKKLVPVDKFRYERATWRGKLSDLQNTALDLVVRTLQHLPTLSGIKWATEDKRPGKKKS